jgi:hypothetical protein
MEFGMRRLIFLLSVSLGLGACGSQSDLIEAKPVAVKTLLSMNKGKPFECVNYDEPTDSCEAINRIRVRSDKIFFSTDFLLVGPVGETVRATVDSNFALENGGYCGSLANSRIRFDGNLTATEQRAFREITGVVMSMTGEFCDRYFIDEFGRTFSLSFDAEGQAREDSLSFVTFHRSPKRLRL